VHKFDENLQLVQSSPVVSYDRPINSLCVTERYIFTKDRFGSIGKWDADSLIPLDFYDGKSICNRSDLFDGEVPSPTPNRGITYFNGQIYTNNAFNQMVVLNAETFEVVDIRKSPSSTFIDCICTDHPQVHAMSDVEGNLYIGNLELYDFPIIRKIDENVVHCVIYDKRHDRFWTTQDGGLGDDNCVRTGVTTIEKDGSGFKEYKLSHEDNEFIEFDPDHRYLFAGGFNGKISIFDNEKKEFCLKKIIGPLEFQIIHAAIVSKDQFYVLLQTGDLLCLNSEGQEICRAEYTNKCVWTLEPHPNDDSLLYAGTDQGVALVRYQSSKFDLISIEQIDHHLHGFGIIKDVKPLDDGSYIAISRKGNVFKVSDTGAIEWHRDLLGIPRGIGINHAFDRCLVSTDEGTVWELHVKNGAVIDRMPVGSPSYACAYAADGRRVITASAGRMVKVYAANTHEILGSINFKFRLKRLIRASNSEIFVTGPDGMFELDLTNYTRRRSFGDYLVSTKENGVLCDGYLYVGGYGYQLASYRYFDGQIVYLEETLPDFTKAFAARIPDDGPPILLVGGRGGFISAYRLYEGIPRKVREFYLR
jgi:outer membrane protein assembly factor BamB